MVGSKGRKGWEGNAIGSGAKLSVLDVNSLRGDQVREAKAALVR